MTLPMASDDLEDRNSGEGWKTIVPSVFDLDEECVQE